MMDTFPIFYTLPSISDYVMTMQCQVLRLELAKFQVSVVTVQPGDFSKATNLLNDHHRWELLMCNNRDFDNICSGT